MNSQCQCKQEAHSWNSTTAPANIKPYPVQQNYSPAGPCLPPYQAAQTAIFNNFHEAIGTADVKVLEELIQKDITLLKLRGFNGQLPLHRACLRGDLNIVQLLLKRKADPNAVDDFGETPLHFACKRGNILVIHSLIQYGADTRLEDKAGKGALHHAAHGGNMLVLHYLLEGCGLNVHVRDRNLSTPMHIVCMHGHMEAFDYLMKKDRSDPFSRDAQGNSLLHICALHGNSMMCIRLLEKSGSKLLFETNVEGCTALDLAKRGNLPSYVETIKMFVFYMSASSPVKNMEIRGPIVAWYCLLALPFLMYPITYLLAVNFTNRGPVTLIGVVAMLFFRVFHSHRMSHALRWPSPAHAGMFAAGMFYTMAFAFLELAPYLFHDHACLISTSFISAVAIVYLYYVLFTRNPGVVKESNKKASGEYFNITDVASGLVTIKEFCSKCEIVAPPLTTHCRLCEKCYSHVDHHCLYLYKCIAKNNHRLFIFFNLVVMASMLMFEFSCVLYVNIFFPGRTLDGSLVYELFASYPCLWALFVLNGQGLIWGVWLMKVQYNVISKGRILSYSKYTEKSHLLGKQKFLNVVYFFLNKEPYARDSVFNA